MSTIVRDGIKLAFEDHGAGKPAFVFVHGWTCDRSFFAPQAEHFAPRHRVVSVDLRGHARVINHRGHTRSRPMLTILLISLYNRALVRQWRSATAWRA